MIKTAKWSEGIYDLTPVEQVGGVYFKREDLFTPNGPGSVNGSKLRQLIDLLNRAKIGGAKGVVSGAVLGSPQHLMTAAVADNLGMGCVLVSNTKEPEKHSMLKLSMKYSPELRYCASGFARTLESRVFKFVQHTFKDYFPLETNITVSEKRNPPKVIREFHSLGAHQAINIPGNVTRLIIPCGSCNSATSVLYGLFINKVDWIEDIYLMGIGSHGSRNINYIFDRMENFDPETEGHYPRVESEGFKGLFDSELPTRPRIHYYNLNGSGYCKYNDLMPFSYHGIDFHPRYEGKVMNYINDGHVPGLDVSDGRTLFWIVGSEPKF